MMKSLRQAGWAAGVLAAALWVPASASAQSRKAPELDGGVGWFNTDKPVTIGQLKGKIVLLDFWTYC